MRRQVWIAVPAMLVLALAAVARADDKPVDSQFHALADSRTNADLALRKARDYFGQGENVWRAVSSATEQARGRIADQIQKDVQAEQRKPDETRDNDKINSLNDRAHQIDIEWNNFGNTERPAIEQRYREAQQVIQTFSQIYQDLANLEGGWKDSKLDLTSLQASFDALTHRSDEAMAQAQKAVDDLKAAQKLWESMPEIVTPPAKQ